MMQVRELTDGGSATELGLQSLVNARLSGLLHVTISGPARTIGCRNSAGAPSGCARTRTWNGKPWNPLQIGQ